LKQIPVDETTMSMRRYRRKSLLTTYDRNNLLSLVSKVIVDPKVSNIPLERIAATIDGKPNEAYVILQLLTYFEHAEDGKDAYAKAFFELDKGKVLCLSMMTFIYPEGLSLLKSHADAIFCDSMWSINEDGDHILTIVVANRENKLRLVASAIDFSESQNHWELFFAWVKQCVKEFDPKFIVTDGADYIHNAYANTVKNNAVHAICWWHKNRVVKRLFGSLGAAAKKITDYGIC